MRDLRDQLPGIEPERRVTDWGRSSASRACSIARSPTSSTATGSGIEVEGVESVPADGGALLVSNHSGALPPDAPMIAKAVKEEHSRPRPVHITVEHFFKGYPGFSMLLAEDRRASPAHPANVHRLLYDERQLVLVFPEGRKGTEKLYKDRYRLRRFGRGGFVAAAMRARAPDRPGVRRRRRGGGADLRPGRVLQRLTGLLYFPITPTFPTGLAGMLGYLPAKFRIRFLEPIPTDAVGPEPWRDSSLVQTVAQDVRAVIQENLSRWSRERSSVWFG